MATGECVCGGWVSCQGGDWLGEIRKIYLLAECFNDCLPGKFGGSPTGEKRDSTDVMTEVMSFCMSHLQIVDQIRASQFYINIPDFG
jgi:hypothetical protein